MIEYELNQAIIAALKANLELKSYVNGRIWAETPPNNTFPFVFVGDMTVQTSDEDFIFTDIEVTVQAFSNTTGIAEILKISGLVREILNQEFAVNGYLIAEYYHMQTSFPNVIEDTKQGIISLRYKLCKSE